MGAVMIVVAVAMIADLDLRFQDAIADDLPSVLVNPTERTGAQRRGLRRRWPRSAAATARGRRGRRAGGRGRAVALPDLRRRRPTSSTPRSGSTPSGRPLSIEELTGQGQVVLIDFWTYTCINCIRTLPYLEAWDAAVPRRRAHGRRRPHARVPVREGRRQRRRRDRATTGSRYPVVQDNELGTWTAFGNQYWPAKYLIDADGRGPLRPLRRGRLRGDRARDPLPARRGRARATSARAAAGRGRDAPIRTLRTPETYLGAARAQGWVERPRSRDAATTAAPSGLAWTEPVRLRRRLGRSAASRRPRARRRRRSLALPGAPRLPGPGLAAGQPREVRVLLDGKPIPDRRAGEDVHGGVATDRRQRLYRLVDLPRAGRHLLTLRFEPGDRGLRVHVRLAAGRACGPRAPGCRRARRQARLEQRGVEPLEGEVAAEGEVAPAPRDLLGLGGRLERAQRSSRRRSRAAPRRGSGRRSKPARARASRELAGGEGVDVDLGLELVAVARRSAPSRRPRAGAPTSAPPRGRGEQRRALRAPRRAGRRSARARRRRRSCRRAAGRGGTPRTRGRGRGCGAGPRGRRRGRSSRPRTAAARRRCAPSRPRARAARRSPRSVVEHPGRDVGRGQRARSRPSCSRLSEK